MFTFSERTGWDQHPNALNQLLGQLKLKGITVTDLTESNPTRCGIKYPPAILNALSNPNNLSYEPESLGITSARQAAASFLSYDPKRVVLTASTSESYGYLFKLLLNPHDKVLIPKPSYPLFQFLLELNDAVFDYYPLEYANNAWGIDFNALERLIDAKTKAIILVNPNNPTGSYIKRDELKRLNDICRKYGLSIISDEVFYEYRLSGGDYVSLRDNQEVPTFTLGGLSKSLALPQMKLGWMMLSGPDDLVQGSLNRLEIIADTYLSVNTPVQHALPVWLDHAEQLRNQILAQVKANLDFLSSLGVNILTVEGGWYAVINIGNIDEEEFVLKALKEHHVLVHPGFLFDFDQNGCLVVSLLPPFTQFVNIKKIFRR